MAISDKTRKVLWARSGNLCAFCRRGLVVDATALDEASVVGEECHIISGQLEGPRFRPELAQSEVDHVKNLILLCATHHKMVDDQTDTYSVEALKELKLNHEAWVASTLGASFVKPVRLRRSGPGAAGLVRVTAGVDLFRLLEQAGGSKFHHPEPRQVADAELIGGFLQSVKDWVDIAADLEPAERVRAASSLSAELVELQGAGLWVFAANEPHVVEGGIGPPLPFGVLILRLEYADSDEIVALDISGARSRDRGRGG